MAMYQITFSPTDFFVSALLFSVATTSFASNDTNWDHQPFDCGPLKHLSLTPSPPNPTAAHPIESTFRPPSHRVLRLNQTDRTMTLARSDLWIGTTRTCLTEFTNTTLNSTLLNYSPDDEDLTIFYGSSNFTLKPSNLFNCSINGTSSTAFYLTGPILNIATCSVGVRLKILQTVAHELTSNRITLREALMEGFNVNYGDCGIQPCRTPDSPEWNRQFKILIDVSASIVGAVGVVPIMIVCYLKKEQLSNMAVMRKKNAKENQYAKAFIINQGSLAPKQYSYSNITKMTHLFKNKQGQGGYESVYKGKLLDSRLVAVKVINELKGSEEEFFNEVASISRTSHVNIVTLYGYCYERTKRALVYEFMPNGSLDKFIYNHESSSTDCQLEQKILLKIAVGVAQ